MHQEKGVHVKFEMFPILHSINSKAAGREIYIDKPYVRIRVAGMDKDEAFLPVNDQIKARFPDEWALFQQGIEAPRVGTPLHAWGRITPAMARNLETFDIHTVEDIATLSEIGLQKVGMGSRQLQEDARKFLSQSQVAADLGKMDALEAENASLKTQMAELAATVAAMKEQMKPKGKKRGNDEEAQAA